VEPSGLKWPPSACRSKPMKLRAARTGDAGRAGAALTTTGRADTSRWLGSGKRDRKVYERNQCHKASSTPTGSNPEDTGRDATRAHRGRL
jgi:hypothetical protein